MSSSKCLVAGCGAPGEDYTSKSGVTARECPAHAKIRILTDTMEQNEADSKKTAKPKLANKPLTLNKVTPDSTPMPRLEHLPSLGFSSGDISTGSSTGILDKRMKDIGGEESFKDYADHNPRDHDRPYSPVCQSARRLSAQPRLGGRDQRRSQISSILSCASGSSAEKNKKSPKEGRKHRCKRKSRSTSSRSSHRSMSSSVSRSGNSPGSESSSSRYGRNRKGEKRSRAYKRGIHDLLPEGLCFPKIKRSRPVVRQCSQTERLQPDGEMSAIIGRLGLFRIAKRRNTGYVRLMNL